MCQKITQEIPWISVIHTQQIVVKSIIIIQLSVLASTTTSQRIKNDIFWWLPNDKNQKSELKSHLQQSIHILKRSLDYATYCYFILAVLFFYHASETPSLYRANLNVPRIVVSSRAVPVRVSFQRKKRDLHDELTIAFSEFESTSPLDNGYML